MCAARWRTAGSSRHRLCATWQELPHTCEFETLTQTVDHCGSMDESADENEHSELISSTAELTESDIADLVAFLRSLTDESFLNAFERPEPILHASGTEE